MNELFLFAMRTILIGLGATLTFDLWALLLKHVFHITPSDICLVGRWVRYMPKGIFHHANLRSAAAQRRECLIGWSAHYLIGTMFTITFVALVGDHWLQQPTLLPALLFGVVTVLAPFLIMHPAFGLGVAAAKTTNPAQARVRSLMNHTAFGCGLYLFGWLLSQVI
ncbi:MAG: DUF2938 domain-containing protein [Caldilineaceae bacterium]|nr:DUF2938 domain-containing protein [Caldilineaceae bacterium]